MYHPRLKGKPHEMGRKMGELFIKAGAKFHISLDPFQKEFGRESVKILSQIFPEAADEIKGIADVTGMDYMSIASWMMCMGCCLDPVHGNCMEVRGCTAFSFTHEGRVFHGRNNDLPPFLKKTSMSEFYRPEKGFSFILNTSSFVNGEEGMNENGLIAAMTFVIPKKEEIIPGLNSVFIVRYILEKCTTASEAIELLRKIPIASNCNIILTDNSGMMIVAECNPFEINLRYPEKNPAGDHFIITVNHFTSEAMKKHEISTGNTFYSEERYRTAYTALKNKTHCCPTDYAREILQGRHGFMCQYEKSQNFETIWSSVFDLSELTIYLSGGDPRRSAYLKDLRLKKHMSIL
jgi:predicted choloylglycine hydrolase